MITRYSLAYMHLPAHIHTHAHTQYTLTFTCNMYTDGKDEIIYMMCLLEICAMTPVHAYL